MAHKPSVIVIVGPTAVGKSDLAVAVAKRYGGEVVSADSRQVYRGMDLGTGKVTKKEMAGIPHHLIDVASPRRAYTAARYQKEAQKAVDGILARGNMPVIAGGTGFYVDALLYDQSFPEVPPDASLRKKLEKLATEDLFSLLQEKDPERAGDIDRHNRPRLIRAIEIAAALGSVPKAKQRKSPYDPVFIGLDLPDDILKERIHARLEKRMRQGLAREAERLHEEGVSWKRMHALGLEYRYLAELLQGRLSKEEMLEQLARQIWKYAKRQRTWFKRNKDIAWFRPGDGGVFAYIEERVGR